MSRGENSGAILRNEALALRVVKLSSEGLTSRQIAESVGKRPEQIKALRLLGERILAREQS